MVKNMEKAVNKNIITTENEYRYERKFYITGIYYQELEKAILSHPAHFKKLYSERQVNNIYWDTPDYTSYHENVNGLSDREKIRIRWYGSLWGNINKPVLELKYRKAMSGYKSFVPLEDFSLYLSHTTGKILKSIFISDNLNEHIKEKLNARNPVLLNSYTRRYYQSSCGKFRITLDYDLKYHRIYKLNKISQIPIKDNNLVLEIKYDIKDEDKISDITKFLPFRFTRKSKYVSGIDNLVRSGNF